MTRNESSLSFRAVMYGGQLQFSPSISASGTDNLNLIRTDDACLETDQPASIGTLDVLKFNDGE